MSSKNSKKFTTSQRREENLLENPSSIQKKLQKLGFKIIMPPLVTYVENKTTIVHLKEGELEKAKKYAEDLAGKLYQ